MQFMKSDASLSSLDWALPVRRFGLLLSIACLSLSGCRAVAPEESDDESSSENESAEGSQEQDPEESEEDNDDDEGSQEPEDSEEDDEDDEEDSEEDDEDPEKSDGGEGGGGSEGGERDCEKIEWGKKGVKKGEIVARGDVQGFADGDGDFEPEKKEVDAGMCELHLTKYRCALVLYGAG